jgi:hypothetical protein
MTADHLITASVILALLALCALVNVVVSLVKG